MTYRSYNEMFEGKDMKYLPTNAHGGTKTELIMVAIAVAAVGFLALAALYFTLRHL